MFRPRPRCLPFVCICAALTARAGAPPCLLGDADCNGAVDFDDIDPFVSAVVGHCIHQRAFPGCAWRNCDCNGDELVDFNDIDAFIRCLVHGGCAEIDPDRCVERAFAFPQSAVVFRDGGATILLPGGGTAPARFEIARPPRHGGLGLIAVVPPNLAHVRYTPDSGYEGADDFAFRAALDTGEWADAAVSVQVVSPPALPAGCPVVTRAADGTLVRNGERVFPFGFWGSAFVDLREGWPEYSRHFSSLVAGPSPQRSVQLEANGILWFAQGALRFDPSAAPPEQIDAADVVANAANSFLCAWEVQHEPNTFPPTSAQADVARQAELIRELDPCQRPVMVTPTAGANEQYETYAAATDITAVLYYPVPRMALATIGNQMAEARGFVGDDTLIYTMRVAGWQPGRYREYLREATADEVRAAAYLAVGLGARGVHVYNHSKGELDAGQRGFPELYDSTYNIEDSPALYADLKQVGQEFASRAALLASPLTPLASASADVATAIIDVNGALPGGEYLLAVNVADEPSRYFEYVIGARVEQLRAYAYDANGRVFPQTRCANGLDDDGDGRADLLDCDVDPETCDRLEPEACDCDCTGPDDDSENSVYPWRTRLLAPGDTMLRRITGPPSDSPYDIRGARIYIAAAAPGTRMQLAVYADGQRDGAPDTRVYLSGEFTVTPSDPANRWIQHRFPAPIVLENTREYFVVYRVVQGSVTVHWQDARIGARVRAGAAIELAETFPPLHAGRSIAVTLPVAPGFRHFRAVRTLNATDEAPGEIALNEICDSFAPYAVHLYQLLP